MEWQGKARQGKARQGKARQGKQGKARQGTARQGKARQGTARQGKGTRQIMTQTTAGDVRVRVLIRLGSTQAKGQKMV